MLIRAPRLPSEMSFSAVRSLFMFSFRLLVGSRRGRARVLPAGTSRPPLERVAPSALWRALQPPLLLPLRQLVGKRSTLGSVQTYSFPNWLICAAHRVRTQTAHRSAHKPHTSAHKRTQAAHKPHTSRTQAHTSRTQAAHKRTRK